MSSKKSQCNQLITRLSNHPGIRGSSKWKQAGRNNENLRVLDSSIFTEEKSEEALLQEIKETSSKPTIEKTFENELDEISESSLSLDEISVENWEKISEGSFEHLDTDEEEYFSDLEILDEHVDDENKENEFTVEYRTCVPKYLKPYKALDFYKPKILILSNNKFSVCCVSAVCSENTANDCGLSEIPEPIESVEPVTETPVVSSMESEAESPDLEIITAEKNDSEMHSQSQSSAIQLSPTGEKNDDDVVIVFDSADTIVVENNKSVSVAKTKATCEVKSGGTGNYGCVADRPNLKVCMPTCAIASKSTSELSSGDQKAATEGEHESSACLKIIPGEVKRSKHCTKHATSTSEKTEVKSVSEKSRCYRSDDKKFREAKKLPNSRRYRSNEQDTSEKRSVSPHRESPLQNKNVCLGEKKLDSQEKKHGKRLDSSHGNNISKSLCSSEDARVDVSSKNRNFHGENDSVHMIREKTNRGKDHSERENRGNSNSGNWQFLTTGSKKRKLTVKKAVDRNLEDSSTSKRPAYKAGNNSRYSSKRGEMPFSKKSPDRSSVESFGSRLSGSRKYIDSDRNTRLSKRSEVDLRDKKTMYSGESQLRNLPRFKKTESIISGSRSSVRDKRSRERSLTRKRSSNDTFDKDSRSRVSVHSVSKEARVFRRSTSPKRRRESPDRYKRRRESPDNPRSSRRRESPDSPRSSRRRESPGSSRSSRRRGSPSSYRNSRRRASLSKHSDGDRSPRRRSPSNFESFSKLSKTRSKYSRSPEKSHINVSAKKLSRNISRSPERFVQTADKTSDAIINKFMPMSPSHSFQHGIQAYQVSQSSLPGFLPSTQPSPQSMMLQSQNPMYPNIFDHSISDGIKSSHGVYDSRMNSMAQMDAKLSENQRSGNLFPSVYPHLPVSQGSFNPLCATNPISGHASLSDEKLFSDRYASYNVPSVTGFNCPNPYAQTSDLNKHQSDSLRLYSSGSSSGIQSVEKSQDVFKNMQSVVNKLFGTSLASQTEANNMKPNLSSSIMKSENYIGSGNPSKGQDFFSSVTGAKSVLQSDLPHATRVVQMRDISSNSKFRGDSDNILSLKNQEREIQNFEPYNFQGPSGNYQKTSLVQRLASVLMKLQMTDLPEHILSEMLVKIGAFNDSLPSHDISEAQIIAVLRQFNYIW